MNRIQKLAGCMSLLGVLCAVNVQAGEAPKTSWGDSLKGVWSKTKKNATWDNAKAYGGQGLSWIQDNMFAANNANFDINHLVGVLCGATFGSNRTISLIAAGLNVAFSSMIEDKIFGKQKLAQLVAELNAANDTKISEALQKAAASYTGEGKITSVDTLIEKINGINEISDTTKNIIKRYVKPDITTRLYHTLAGGAVGIGGSAAFSMLPKVMDKIF